MRAYNFQKQFARKILNGSKPHTIRARRKDGYVPTPGERIRLYTGMRTRQCELLREVDVISARPIVINYGNPIVLDGKPLTFFEACELAERDGFENFGAFMAFFKDKHGTTFNGYLIEWKP